jgi:D-alanyl-D-alanine-carboxypeptidase/D-alanyl-D-alanine-endopeptidase
MLRILALMLSVLLAAPVQASAQSGRAPAAVSDSEILHILAERIDRERRGMGIVVGVVTPQGRRVISHGSFALGDPRRLDGDTVFEIGSVGKVFTALLLADMTQRGEVGLHDPVATYLPEVRIPQHGGRTITLADLATHMSGLPRLPTNFAPRDPANPYADYSVEQLYAFLSNYELTRDVGVHYEYSNLGFGLLGHVLARRAGTNYETLVIARVAARLGLHSTAITLAPDLMRRLAIGHNENLLPVPNWDDTTLAGAGALYSSVNDLLTFLDAHLAQAESPLGAAMADLLALRKPTGRPNLHVALGWHVSIEDGRELVWHNGGTGGYSSFIGFCPQTGVGIVVLANSEIGVDDIALRVLGAGTRAPCG